MNECLFSILASQQVPWICVYCNRSYKTKTNQITSICSYQKEFQKDFVLPWGKFLSQRRMIPLQEKQHLSPKQKIERIFFLWYAIAMVTIYYCQCPPSIKFRHSPEKKFLNVLNFGIKIIFQIWFNFMTFSYQHWCVCKHEQNAKISFHFK